MAGYLNIIKESLEAKNFLNRLGGGVIITGGGSVVTFRGGGELVRISPVACRIGIPKDWAALWKNIKSAIFPDCRRTVLYAQVHLL